MNKTHVNPYEKDREEKTKFSEILPNNQIITACRIELRVQEMTMNEKLTMIRLRKHHRIPAITFYSEYKSEKKRDVDQFLVFNLN